ncbi:MAG TPA: isoprenylcysteine carboxylmethyltransferase family protein [Candidatus Dormibacteraeota bacterium]
MGGGSGLPLRTDGPYRVTRHPIYTGMLGMLVGTALLGGVGRWAVVLAVGVVYAAVKIRAEERLLGAEFPEDYPRYRERVPQLVPASTGWAGRGDGDVDQPAGWTRRPREPASALKRRPPRAIQTD